MPSALEERARALAVAQDFGAEALDVNRRLVAANPSDEGSRTRLARCYVEAGRLDEAEAEYRAVLAANPRNRIAAGGLEAIQQRRMPPPEPRTRTRRANPASASATASADRKAGSRKTEEWANSASAFGEGSADTKAGSRAGGAASGSQAIAAEPIPQTFSGFGPGDFAELAACRRGYVQARFAPRVIDLVRRVNALSSSVEMAGVREAGKRQLFRVGRSDVHPAEAHWYVFNLGGRWEPQCNIGMYGGGRVGNWLRIGIGYNLADEGQDRDRESGAAQVRDHFQRFQRLLASPRRSLLLGWMVKENARLEYEQPGPRLDVREPSQAASVIADIDPADGAWVFVGKWLGLQEPDEAAVLADPLALVRTIDRVFTGLMPLWRTLYER